MSHLFLRAVAIYGDPSTHSGRRCANVHGAHASLQREGTCSPCSHTASADCRAQILLSLREIIREEDQNTRVTLLEYLKQLHPVEWENFVKDTKILAEESAMFNGPSPFGNDEKGQSKMDDLPFYCIGFKSAAPEFTLRTRIWASLRAQTLYRTVSGMMNYAKAIKLLYRVENP